MDVVIRKAHIDELKTIQDLNFELFQSDKDRDLYLNHDWPYAEGEKIFAKMLTSESCVVFVAELDKQIVGYLAGALIDTVNWRPVKRTELENMYDKQDHRSRGIGAKLVEHFLAWSKSKGVEKALVVAYASNDKALKFYQKMGFSPESISLEAKV